ncbi:hypothetical protein D3C85_1402870 [compost metagenome]
MLSGDFTVSDVIKKMATVNHAIAEKKCGRQKEMESILSGTDWSSSREEFHLCVAAVREDINEVSRLIPRLINSDWVRPHCYFEWPAFEWLRKEKKFWELLESEYGEEIRRSVDEAVEEGASMKSKKDVGV